MRLTVRDLRHLAAELRAFAAGLEDVARGLAPDTGLDFPPSAMTARLFVALIEPQRQRARDVDLGADPPGVVTIDPPGELL